MAGLAARTQDLDAGDTAANLTAAAGFLRFRTRAATASGNFLFIFLFLTKTKQTQDDFLLNR